jgi:hypothetical protein
LEIECRIGWNQVFGGTPLENMYAVGIASHWDVSYTMFNDGGSFQVKF